MTDDGAVTGGVDSEDDTRFVVREPLPLLVPVAFVKSVPRSKLQSKGETENQLTDLREIAADPLAVMSPARLMGPV